MHAAVLVFLGAGTGGVLRHAASVLLTRFGSPSLPYATLFVNVLGAFALGLLVGFLAHSAQETSAQARLFLATGVLGGFTTFSAFSLDTLTLLERNQPLLAAAYVGASVFGGLLALWLGLRLARLAG